MLSSSPLTEASDGLAIAMVLLLGFALGMILTILIVMARHSGRKPDLELEDDEERPDAVTPIAGKDSPRDSWEKDPDWWRDSQHPD